jgi:pre-mRNA-splicing factor RBM22/SLT11
MGQNPYVRMIKMPYGQKLCKISNLPYQAFRWKAGPQGRYKETIISIEVARERNICQACLNDMKYGVPAGVRDSILKHENQLARPTSEVGQMYHYQQLARTQGESSGDNLALEDIPRAAATQLDRLSRALQVAEAKSKTAFRNLPKLCSFWLNGSCTRVLRKTCPFRPCCGTFVFPEIAGSARELCAQLIERLEKEGPAAVQKSLDSATKEAFRDSMKGNREEAIRQRVSGEDDLTKKYLGKMKASVRTDVCSFHFCSSCLQVAHSSVFGCSVVASSLHCIVLVRVNRAILSSESRLSMLVIHAALTNLWAAFLPACLSACLLIEL